MRMTFDRWRKWYCLLGLDELHVELSPGRLRCYEHGGTAQITKEVHPGCCFENFFNVNPGLSITGWVTEEGCHGELFSIKGWSGRPCPLPGRVPLGGEKYGGPTALISETWRNDGLSFPR